MTGKIGRTGQLNDIVLNGDGDVRVDDLAQFAERSFNLHHIAIDLAGHFGRKVYRQFTNS